MGGVQSAHARDRRSFIDKDSGIQQAPMMATADASAAAAAPSVVRNNDGHSARSTSHDDDGGGSGSKSSFGQQQQAMTHRPQIADDDGLWQGAAPVCCVCQTRIQR